VGSEFATARIRGLILRVAVVPELYAALAFFLVLLILGVIALIKCEPKDIPDVLRALFGRK
jgi:hypothetical protein